MELPGFEQFEYDIEGMMDEIKGYENGTEEPSSEDLSSAAWQDELRASEKYLEQWHSQGDRVNRRYLDKRSETEEGKSKVNLFTTNTNILLATLYAKFPKPVVTREFDDQDDDVARVAALTMERMLKIRKRDPFDSAIRAAVKDYLVPGLGAVWFRYDPTSQQIEIPPVIDPMTGAEIEPASQGMEIVDEEAACDYVHWKDVRWSPTRIWEQLRWVGRRIALSKRDVIKRFGEIVAGQLSYRKGIDGKDKNSTNLDISIHDTMLYTDIYEIWCKSSKTVYWVSMDLPVVLDKRPDPLKLPGFFPTPKFLMALTSTSDMLPRPDFLMVQDQYEELDNVNHRITLLERAIKVVGIYDGTNPEVERVFQEAVDMKIIPSRSFAEFREKGGFKGAIDWLPIDEFAKALERLRIVRQDIVAQIYELTGISDIMRGSSRATETLGAQQLKAQYGSVRLQFRQMDVADFVEEALEIRAAIIRNHFQPDTIFKKSNVGATPDAPLAEQAISLLKSPEYEMRVEVQADSMAVPEFNAEREDRMAYARMLAELLTGAAPIIEKSPASGVPLLKVVQWVGSSFRTASTIEGILDQAIVALQKDISTPKPPAQPPALEVAKTKQAESQAVLNLAKAHEAGAGAVRDLTEPIGLPESPKEPGEDTAQIH